LPSGRLPRARLANEVYDVLLADLMSLKIRPGARITVDALARELGVSQTPLREALGRLEADGLVHKTPLVGYHAAPQIGRDQFEQLFELRLLLEPYAAGRAAERVDAGGLGTLRGLMEEMAATSDDGGHPAYQAFARLDARFHDTIVGAGGNELIRTDLARLHTHVHLFRLMFHHRVTAEALDEHAAILRALESGDPAAAEAAMRTHIERSRARFRPAFEAAPPADRR